jgi:LETM1 and EF-hand domain-containing protein 1
VRTAARPSRNTRGHISALAILLPHRGYATEHQTSTSSGNYPPPGFNAEQARKPLPKEEQQKLNEKSNSFPLPDIHIPENEPTALPKTEATKAHTLTEMAMEKAAAEAKDEKAAVAKKEEPKKTLWQKVKHEAQHYWDGTKLLVAEVKISSKLALKMAAGYELTRREHRQVHRSR